VSAPVSSARTKRAALLAGMGAATTAIWTGSPLLAVWVGSRVQTGTAPSMTALLLVLGTLAVTSYALIKLLAVLGAAHDRLSNRQRARRQAPWLRSLRGDRQKDISQKDVGAPERVLVGCVVLAVLAFEVWFFFLSGSSLPNS